MGTGHRLWLSGWFGHVPFAVESDDEGTASPPSETSDDTTSGDDSKTKTEIDAENPAAENQGAENVLVIDTTFTCKIVAPNVEPFEVKVSLVSIHLFAASGFHW